VQERETGGKVVDMEIQVKEILKMKQTLEEILANHSGKTVKEVTKACERDNFMSPKEAKDFGLIEQQRLQASLRTRESLLQILETEFIRERLGRKLTNSLCARDTRISDELNDAELPLIAEN